MPKQVDDALVNHAKAFLRERFPQGGGTVAAVYLEDGQMLLGVATDALHEQVGLCAETGPICEAFRLNKAVVASVCMSDDNPEGVINILTPCGICQERLLFWGPQVSVAVPQAGNFTQWEAKTLAEVQPYFWYKVYQP